jgi:hypothetical protein
MDNVKVLKCLFWNYRGVFVKKTFLKQGLTIFVQFTTLWFRTVDILAFDHLSVISFEGTLWDHGNVKA